MLRRSQRVTVPARDQCRPLNARTTMQAQQNASHGYRRPFSAASQLICGMLGVMNAIRSNMRARFRKRNIAALPCILAVLLLMAGCATTSSGPGVAPTPTLAPEETGRYEPVVGRGPDIVADLRAAAPPAEPAISDGKSIDADRKRLGAQSFMQIGTSHFPAADASARNRALDQGRRVGADRVIFYATPAGGELTVAYYVRFKLPFGATFRDLRDEERRTLDASGGVAIGSIVDDSPAARANLLAGDIVLEVDGKPIVNRADFQAQLRARAGHPVTLTLVRNGEMLQRVVRLGPMTSAS